MNWNSDEYWGLNQEELDVSKLLDDNLTKLQLLLKEFKTPKVNKTVDSIKLEWQSNAALIEININSKEKYKWNCMNYVHLESVSGESVYESSDVKLDKILWQYFKK